MHVDPQSKMCNYVCSFAENCKAEICVSVCVQICSTCAYLNVFFLFCVCVFEYVCALLVECVQECTQMPRCFPGKRVSLLTDSL